MAAGEPKREGEEEEEEENMSLLERILKRCSLT